MEWSWRCEAIDIRSLRTTDEHGCRQIAKYRLRGQAPVMDRELAPAQNIPPRMTLQIPG